MITKYCNWPVKWVTYRKVIEAAIMTIALTALNDLLILLAHNLPFLKLQTSVVQQQEQVN